MYFSFAIDLFYALLGNFGPFGIIGLFVSGAGAWAAYGIANDSKVAYMLGIVCSGLEVLAQLLIFFAAGGLGAGGALLFLLLGLIFAIARLALLLHTQSREHVRIWFR